MVFPSFPCGLSQCRKAVTRMYSLAEHIFFPKIFGQFNGASHVLWVACRPPCCREEPVTGIFSFAERVLDEFIRLPRAVQEAPVYHASFLLPQCRRCYFWAAKVFLLSCCAHVTTSRYWYESKLISLTPEHQACSSHILTYGFIIFGERMERTVCQGWLASQARSRSSL